MAGVVFGIRYGWPCAFLRFLLANANRVLVRRWEMLD